MKKFRVEYTDDELCEEPTRMLYDRVLGVDENVGAHHNTWSCTPQRAWRLSRGHLQRLRFRVGRGQEEGAESGYRFSGQLVRHRRRDELREMGERRQRHSRGLLYKRYVAFIITKQVPEDDFTNLYCLLTPIADCNLGAFVICPCSTDAEVDDWRCLRLAADVRKKYMEHIWYILNRKNTFNGRVYKDDPTIM